MLQQGLRCGVMARSVGFAGSLSLAIIAFGTVRRHNNFVVANRRVRDCSMSMLGAMQCVGRLLRTNIVQGSAPNMEDSGHEDDAGVI